MYCPKCGKKSEDGVKFCNECGASLTGENRDMGKQWESRCDEECSGRKHHENFAYFWIAIICLVILGVVISIIVKLAQLSYGGIHVPSWMVNFPYWDFCGLIIALAFLLFLLSILVRTMRKS